MAFASGEQGADSVESNAVNARRLTIGPAAHWPVIFLLIVILAGPAQSAPATKSADDYLAAGEELQTGADKAGSPSEAIRGY